MSLSPSASTSLRRFDFDAISASSVPFGLLVVPGHEVQIGGKEMSVFGYPTEEALDTVRSGIRPRGDQIPTVDGDLAIIN